MASWLIGQIAYLIAGKRRTGASKSKQRHRVTRPFGKLYR